MGNISESVIVLEAEKSKIKVPADSVTGEGPLLGLQEALVSYLLAISSHGRELLLLLFLRHQL